MATIPGLPHDHSESLRLSSSCIMAGAGGGGEVVNFYSTTGPHGCFSNFSRHPIVVDGERYPTTEHYFQACKFAGVDAAYAKEVQHAASAGEAAKLGRSRAHPLRKDWEAVKDDVMYRACLAKFSAHAEAKRVLLATHSALLVEHTKRDSYWGDGGDGTGQNMLGLTLMKVRDALSKPAAATGATGSASAAAGATPWLVSKKRDAAAAFGAVVEKAGDLLKAKEEFIVQQCNCVSTFPKGLSAVLFKRFPHADIYAPRKASKSRGSPGTISIHGPPGRKVINVLGQVYPGKPRPGADSPAKRLEYFQAGLDHITADCPKLSSIAFPFQIGCGLGGGNWKLYRAAIQDFAAKVAPARVVIYRLP